jgi:hypothetical protein
MKDIRTPLSIQLFFGFAAAAQAGEPTPPQFAFSVCTCPSVIERTAGQPFTLDVELCLTQTTMGEPNVGAQGWSLSVAADGVEITRITTQGTAAARFDADPPGLRRLESFEKSEVARGGIDECTDRSGAISAVTLSFIEPVTLPPESTVTVARITVEGDAPAEVGASLMASVVFVDGCGGSG